jgi:hypothetical protein
MRDFLLLGELDFVKRLLFGIVPKQPSDGITELFGRGPGSFWAKLGFEQPYDRGSAARRATRKIIFKKVRENNPFLVI